jgi:hydroxymethylbilane synthase
LARWQAEWVAARLRERTGVEVEFVLVTTQGDRQQQEPIGQLGGQGVFTKELQRALLEERIDVAVHSLKDLTTEPVEGLRLAAVPPRESPRDALVSRDGAGLDQLPAGAVVGTGSHRRQAQLLHARPDLRTAEIRGNVDTRLRKLHEGQYDALILAEAGLVRLGQAAVITQVLPAAVMLPAVGQGALGIEAREDDQATLRLVRQLDDPATHAAVVAERAMLAAVRGGCLAPVGAWGRLEYGQLRLTAAVLSHDGSARLEAASHGVLCEAVAVGKAVAGALIRQGALGLIRAARQLTTAP